MTLEVDFVWLVGLLLAFFGASAAAGKLLLAQAQRHLDDRFEAQEKTRANNHDQVQRRLDGIESTTREDASQWQRVERELLRFQAELPRDYIRRDDFVQAIGGINTRIDNFALRMERALDKRNGSAL